MARKNNGYTRIAKVKRRTGSSTPGRQKGTNCNKTKLKTLYAKDARLYRKDPKVWLAACEEVQKMQREKGINTTLQEFV